MLGYNIEEYPDGHFYVSVNSPIAAENRKYVIQCDTNSEAVAITSELGSDALPDPIADKNNNYKRIGEHASSSQGGVTPFYRRVQK